jgi:hypothetical protein
MHPIQAVICTPNKITDYLMQDAWKYKEEISDMTP